MIDRLELAKYLHYKSVREMYVDLYNKQYMSHRTIGKKLGISNRAVQNDLKRLDIKCRGRGGYNHPKEKSILDKIACLPLQMLKDSSAGEILRYIHKGKIGAYHDLIHMYLERELGIVKKVIHRKRR